MRMNESERPKLRVPFLAVIVTVVLQQAAAFVWYAFLFGDSWVAAQGFDVDYRAAHAGAVTAPLVMIVGNAAGAVLLAFILQLARCPFGLGTIPRGIAWALLLWLCVALPVEATRNLFALRDPSIIPIDAGQSLLCWLIAGIVIGWALDRRDRRSEKENAR